MNSGTTVLAQILAGLRREEFARCARRHPMARATSALCAYDHFALLVFAQLTCRERLRDLEACLQARRPRRYHAGIRGAMKRCHLAYANRQRDARLFAEVTAVLMRRAQRLYADMPAELGRDGDRLASDATLIDLSRARFPWARGQGTQAAVKLNVRLAVASELPAFCTLVAGQRHDVNFLDDVPRRAGAYSVLDRGYGDWTRRYRFHQAGAFFVVRAKANLRLRPGVWRPVDKSAGWRCDQTLRLTSAAGRRG